MLSSSRMQPGFAASLPMSKENPPESKCSMRREDADFLLEVFSSSSPDVFSAWDAGRERLQASDAKLNTAQLPHSLADATGKAYRAGRGAGSMEPIGFQRIAGRLY